MSETKKITIICGPTACGKTALAEDICASRNGEIISADSRQIYRFMDIGTAKPLNSPIRHHLIDIIDPNERYNAATFVRDAITAIDDIISRGKIPMIVGGTGFYITALTNGLFEGEFFDQNLRKALRARNEAGENLHALLQTVDAQAAAKIAPSNYVRIERALEVYYVSGKPISWWWENATKPPSNFAFDVQVILPNRQELYTRIEKRLDNMLRDGWIAETEVLLARGYSETCAGLSSIGYSQITTFLRGELSYTAMREAILIATRHYAKRQITWFRHAERFLSENTSFLNSGDNCLKSQL